MFRYTYASSITAFDWTLQLAVSIDKELANCFQLFSNFLVTGTFWPVWLWVRQLDHVLGITQPIYLNGFKCYLVWLSLHAIFARWRCVLFFSECWRTWANPAFPHWIVFLQRKQYAAVSLFPLEHRNLSLWTFPSVSSRQQSLNFVSHLGMSSNVFTLINDPEKRLSKRSNSYH